VVLQTFSTQLEASDAPVAYAVLGVLSNLGLFASSIDFVVLFQMTVLL
jgi:hypothetical protein